MWLLLVFASIGFSVFVSFQMPQDAGWIMLPVFMVPILAAIVTCAVIQHRIDKNRRLEMVALLQSMGLESTMADDKEAAAAFFSKLAHLETSAMLRDGGARLQWYGYGEIGGQYMVAFEHEYVTGSGRNTQVHTSTCVGFPSEKGGLSFMRPRFGERRAFRKSTDAFDLGDEEFDKEWVLWGTQSYVDSIFSPELVAALSDSPKGEWWCIGGGWKCCITKVALDAENLAKFIAHSNAIARLI